MPMLRLYGPAAGRSSSWLKCTAGILDSGDYFAFCRSVVDFESACSFNGFSRSYPLETWQLIVQVPPVGVFTNTMRIRKPDGPKGVELRISRCWLAA